jgi:hypothetical protein
MSSNTFLLSILSTAGASSMLGKDYRQAKNATHIFLSFCLDAKGLEGHDEYALLHKGAGFKIRDGLLDGSQSYVTVPRVMWKIIHLNLTFSSVKNLIGGCSASTTAN